MNYLKPKLFIFILCSLIITQKLWSQKPTAANKVSNAANAGTVSPNKPIAYPAGTVVNYIRTWEPQQPFTLETDVISNTRTVNEMHETTQYVDGLGRPIQTVGWQTSPGKTDIVAPSVYDEYGREQYKYLPYSASSNDGNFKMNPFNDQNAFYNNYKTQQPGYNNETFFYSKTIFESSPLNSVEKTFAPGNSWVGSEGTASEKSVSTQYLTNTTADAVKSWSITNNALDYNSTDNVTVNIPSSVANYNLGELYKNVTKDEKGDVVVEYKEKEGKVILKKVQIGAVPADFSGFTNFLCTYYVYDDFGMLKFVMPPKAVAKLLSGGALTTDIINELCFRYEYDERQRMIAKKVPGAGWIYMVYDKRDRLVFIQDANMYGKSPRQWAYSLYDDVNHPVQTGIMTYAGTWNDLRNNMDGLSDANSSSSTSGSYTGGVADMYLSTREPGRQGYQASNSIVIQDGFVSEDNALFTAEIIPGPGTGFTNTLVTVNTNPIPSGATLIPLTYTFYDNYSWTTKDYSAANNANVDDGGNANAEALPSSKSLLVEGMVTGTRVRVIEDPNNLSLGKWMESASFYDDKGRVVQANSDNYKGGKDIVTNRYDFTGKMVSNYLVHNNPSGNIADLKVRSSMLYDHAGRLVKITKQIQQGTNITTRTIAQNQYDDLGQLKNKQIGQKPVGDGTFSGSLENQDYTYNIRGWLKGINWDYTSATNKTQSQTAADKWFAMDLSYDWGFQNNDNTAANQFNGNISGLRWMADGDGEERAYGFSYDKANRLMKGDFTRNLSSTWTKDAIINFDMVMGDGSTPGSAYDENGNILKMQQTGLKLTSAGPQSSLVDNISYSYLNSETSNRLRAVTDATGTTDNKLGDFTDNNTTGDDYNYDVNGNLKSDKNKRITLIEYNHLNLPWRITAADASNNTKGTITYIYDATGNKLEKRTNESASSANGNISKVTQTSYLTGFVYENNKLQFFGHEEGRVRLIIPTPDNKNQTFAFDYLLKDHLGNIRTVLTDEKQTNAYPAATMEASNATTENLYYDNIDATRTALPPGYPNDTYTSPNPNSYVSKVIAATGQVKIGPSTILKVMAGDKFNLRVSSWYKTNGVTPGTPVSPLTDIVLALANGVPSISGGKVLSGQLTGTVLNPSVTNFLNNRDASTVTTRPKAYINWVLLDEQFKYVASSSGFEQVPDESYYNNTTSTPQVYGHTKVNLPINKNGYLYVYVSNETQNINVFFDNLQVTHIRGPLVEETHYYPFGLTMSGISSKAAGGVENKKKYNSYELNTDFDLNLYETFYRFHDPQLGRFWQIDPKPTDFESPYAAMGNNPIKNFDLLGDTIIVRYMSDGKQVESIYQDGSFSKRDGSALTKDDYGYGSKVYSDLYSLDKLGDKEVSKRIDVLEDSKNLHFIEIPGVNDNNGNSPASTVDDKNGKPTGSTTKYDPDAKTNVRGDKRDPIVGLAHELLGHGYDSDQGKSNYNKTSNGTPMYEVSGVNIENHVRAKTGDPKKTTYGGQPIPANLLDDTHKKKK
jgi:RHS repeat-associated protein